MIELELYRACVNDCNEAINIDRHCLRAYLLRGFAYFKLDKKSRAESSWSKGVEVHFVFKIYLN